jgi:hypothetical protein
MEQLERLRFSPGGVHTSSSSGYLLSGRLLILTVPQELEQSDHVLVPYEDL